MKTIQFKISGMASRALRRAGIPQRVFDGRPVPIGRIDREGSGR